MGRDIVLTTILTGFLCLESVQAQRAESRFFERDQYKPPESILSRLKPEQALDNLKEITGQRPRSPAMQEAIGSIPYKLFVDQREISIFRPVGDVRKIDFYEDRIELELSRQDRGASTYYYHEMPADMQLVKDSINVWLYGVPVSKEWVLWCTDGGWLEEYREACTKQLADALYVLRNESHKLATSDKAFENVVAEYRKIQPRPTISEDVRRYKVQAEFMIAQKRYIDAIKLYGDGLALSPWWPEGRFNRALLFAEQKRYRDAILEMNRYLRLEPDAPDARAARDNVYKWEAAMKLGVR